MQMCSKHVHVHVHVQLVSDKDMSGILEYPVLINCISSENILFF